MENKQMAGTCAYCGEESDRLFMPPLIDPGDWNWVRIEGSSAWWRPAGQAYPGQNLYDVVTEPGGQYLKPFETPDEPICWECFNGHVTPSERVFVVNKPSQIKFNGWRAPEWLGAPLVK